MPLLQIEVIVHSTTTTSRSSTSSSKQEETVLTMWLFLLLDQQSNTCETFDLGGSSSEMTTIANLGGLQEIPSRVKDAISKES